MLDFIGAHICQAIVGSFTGKRTRLENYLLIKRPKVKRASHELEAGFRAALGG